VLTGAAGADLLAGGAGNDTYVVDNAGDITTELASAGTDLVKAGLSWTLGSNIEKLILTGTGSYSGTGNASSNALTGNDAANTLSGGEGNDTYSGAAGNDAFIDSSLTSSDTYLWAVGLGSDSLADAGGALDHIDLSAGTSKAQLKFTRVGNHLELGVTGHADKLTINNWYLGAAHQIEEFRLSDGSKVLASEVQSLLGAMATFSAPESAGSTPDRWFQRPLRQHGELGMPSLLE